MRLFFRRVLHFFQCEVVVPDIHCRCVATVDYFSRSLFGYQRALQDFYYQRHCPLCTWVNFLKYPGHFAAIVRSVSGCALSRFDVIRRRDELHMRIQRILNRDSRFLCLVVRIADLVCDMIADLHRSQHSVP